MSTFAIVLAQAVATLSLSQVLEMPPPSAGDRILSDFPHGQIEKFKYPTGGMLPPNLIEGQLVERPNLLGSICVRNVWTVLFRATPGADIGTAKPETTRKNQEIEFATRNSCPSGQYAYLNPGIRPEQGEAILIKLKDVNSLHSHAHFECSDETSSGLCAGDSAVRAALRDLKPWLVTDGGNEVLLGMPGGVVTKVSFDHSNTSEASVTRFIPAPF